MSSIDNYVSKTRIMERKPTRSSLLTLLASRSVRVLFGTLIILSQDIPQVIPRVSRAGNNRGIHKFMHGHVIIFRKRHSLLLISRTDNFSQTVYNNGISKDRFNFRLFNWNRSSHRCAFSKRS